MSEYQALVKIGTHYGLEVQMMKTVEELGELTQVITKALLRRTGEEIENKILPENLLEEIADVEIMLAQLQILSNTSEDVKIKRTQKLRRQLDRIDRR